MERCTNCGQLLAVWEDDGNLFWASPDGQIGCVVDPHAKHPCGGTYVQIDFHRAAGFPPGPPAEETPQ